MAILCTLDEGELQSILNDAKDLLLNRLEEREHISKETGEELRHSWHVVVFRKGFFGKLFDKIRGVDTPSSYVRFCIMEDV